MEKIYIIMDYMENRILDIPMFFNEEKVKTCLIQ